MNEFLTRHFLSKIRLSSHEPRLMNTNPVDKALKSRRENVVEAPNLSDILESPEGQPPKIEFMHIDTTENKPESEVPYFINITGAWGTGLEVEGEWLVLAKTMNYDGLIGDAVSIPGHGETSNLKEGWGQEGDFEKSAQTIGEHIKKIKKEQPGRKIILHAWSMGGVTALKVAANYPDLVDGVILVDTPVLPSDFKDTATRFGLYPTQEFLQKGDKKVTKEPPLSLDTPLEGLAIFLKRLKVRNQPKGMPLGEVVLKSAQSLVKQDLMADGTVKKLIENGTQVLLIRGTNDFVIREEQFRRFVGFIRAAGGKIEDVVIEKAGHSLLLEQPRKVARIYRGWLETHEFVKQEKSSIQDPLNIRYERDEQSNGKDSRWTLPPPEQESF